MGYLRKPSGVARPPVLVCWGGIDSFKEERRDEGFLEAGLASLTIDMPGVADAPLAGSRMPSGSGMPSSTGSLPVPISTPSGLPCWVAAPRRLLGDEGSAYPP